MMPPVMHMDSTVDLFQEDNVRFYVLSENQLLRKAHERLRENIYKTERKKYALWCDR